MIEKIDDNVNEPPDAEAKGEGKKAIDMLLFCPQCGEQHVDEAKPDVCEACGGMSPNCPCGTFTPWLNPPHKSHRCNFCNHVWRPADVPTNGVLVTKTKGERDGNPRPRYFYTAKDFDAALAASRQECKRHPGKDEPMNCPQCVVEQRDALAQEEINRLTEAFTSEHRINQDLTAIVNDCIVLLMGNEYRNTHHFRQFQTTLSTSLFRDFGVNLLRTVADLRTQLAAALAERDAAKEEVVRREKETEEFLADVARLFGSEVTGYETTDEVLDSIEGLLDKFRADVAALILDKTKARAEALEEAAKVAEKAEVDSRSITFDAGFKEASFEIAEQIRALSGATGEGGKDE